MISKALVESSPFLPTKLYIRLDVGTARISTLEKGNVDCMTEKLNILKVSQVPVIHRLSQTTSRQLATT